MNELVEKIGELRSCIEGKTVEGVWETMDKNGNVRGVVLLFNKGKFGLFIKGDWDYEEVVRDDEK